MEKLQSARTSSQAVGRLPDFILIGAMRAGSTSIASYLGAHDDVFVSARKELHFFDWHWNRGVDWYRSQFRGAKSGSMAGEATVSYVVYRETMERLAATCPDVRLLMVLRNPVDRAYSHYWYNRMLGYEPLSFREALAAEAGRPSGPAERRTFEYAGRSRYLEQLRRVEEFFPREAVHVVLFEDLTARPGSTFRSVCRFLGVDDSVVPSNVGEAMNGHAVYRSKLVARTQRLLPQRIRRATRRMNRKETGYPPMADDVRAGLEEMFSDEIRGLSMWLGRDLSVWTSTAGNTAG